MITDPTKLRGVSDVDIFDDTTYAFPVFVVYGTVVRRTMIRCTIAVEAKDADHAQSIVLDAIAASGMSLECDDVSGVFDGESGLMVRAVEIDVDPPSAPEAACAWIDGPDVVPYSEVDDNEATHGA